jgi:hypothetical protein
MHYNPKGVRINWAENFFLSTNDVVVILQSPIIFEIAKVLHVASSVQCEQMYK